MVRYLTSLILALGLMAFAGAAAASDYIVVGSTDPAIARGQAFDSGMKAPLGAGQTLTLMHASGDLVRLKGAPGGIILPRRAANQADAERLAVLKVIVSTADKPPAPKMRTRGLCPDAATVTTLDAIVQTHLGGCADEAAKALDAWIAGHPPTDA